MSNARLQAMERFLHEKTRIAAVTAAIHAREARRVERRELVDGMSPRELAEALNQIRVRLASSARRQEASPTERAFSPLDYYELAVLDARMAVYQETEQLLVLEDPGQAELGRIQIALATLRVNSVTGEDVVDGIAFREAAREFFRLAMSSVLDSAAISSAREVRPEDVVLVLPWRAALVAGEVYQGAGSQWFVHLGASRDEHTLATDLYYESRSLPRCTPYTWHVICDPMCATGGTAETAIKWLRVRGLSIQRMIVHAVVAAPEGVDRLLHTYPGLRIVTGALDERLDERGYITGTGIGDFGDLAMRGIDGRYAEEQWVKTGLLTRAEANIVLQRTNGHRTST